MTLRVAAPALASAEALPEIVAFMERVVPRERPWGPDLAWQYLGNPSGVARYVNAYDDSARLIAHYAVLPTPPLAEFAGLLAGTYLSLNVAADPAATIPGLMIATTRALYRQLQADGPVVVVGVTNENSFQGFVRVLRFRSLGRLSLSVYPPGVWPGAEPRRALADDPAHVRWRATRPGILTFGDAGRGGLTVRLRHLGVPLDAVLSVGLPAEAVGALSLPRPARWVPRLYASFAGTGQNGLRVPDRMRPSPLEYVFRVFGRDDLTDPVHRYLSARRFEFIDFDVV